MHERRCCERQMSVRPHKYHKTQTERHIKTGTESFGNLRMKLNVNDHKQVSSLYVPILQGSVL